MVSTLLIGLSLGCVFALIAVGFSVIYQTTGIVNFAQGTFVMIGGLSAGWMSQTFHLPVALAMALGIVVSLVAGAILALTVVLPLWRRGADPALVVVGTFIFTLIVRDIALNLFGSQPISLGALPGPTIRIFGTGVVGEYLWLFFATGLLGGGVLWFLKGTFQGSIMRAVAEDIVTARLMGISPYGQAFLAILLSALIGGVAGVLVAPIQYTSFDLGTAYSVMGFIAAILGGLGSVEGGFISGIITGLLFAFISVDISSTYEVAIAMIVLFVIIVARPQGLFKTTLRRIGN